MNALTRLCLYAEDRCPLSLRVVCIRRAAALGMYHDNTAAGPAGTAGRCCCSTAARWELTTMVPPVLRVSVTRGERGRSTGRPAGLYWGLCSASRTAHAAFELQLRLQRKTRGPLQPRRSANVDYMQLLAHSLPACICHGCCTGDLCLVYALLHGLWHAQSLPCWLDGQHRNDSKRWCIAGIAASRCCAALQSEQQWWVNPSMGIRLS
jgi:hypothetical protein